MRILQLNKVIVDDNRKKFLVFFKGHFKGQDHSFFKDLTGVFCTLGSTLVGNTALREPTLFRATGKRSFACQGGCEA
jgi:hypothetical protein